MFFFIFFFIYEVSDREKVIIPKKINIDKISFFNIILILKETL